MYFFIFNHKYFTILQRNEFVKKVGCDEFGIDTDTVVYTKLTLSLWQNCLFLLWVYL